MNSTPVNIKERLINAAHQYVSLCAVLLVMLVLLRLFEVFVLGNIYHFIGEHLYLGLTGLQYDFIVFFKTCALLSVPYAILYLVKPLAAEIFFITIISILVVISISLQQFFANSMVPLGSDMFAYSWFEITHTVGASGALSIWAFMPFILFILAAIWLWRLLRKKKFHTMLLYPFYLALIIGLFVQGVPNPGKFKTDFESFLVCNKLGFFSSKSFDYFK
jgi:hypothetical protein